MKVISTDSAAEHQTIFADGDVPEGSMGSGVKKEDRHCFSSPFVLLHPDISTGKCSSSTEKTVRKENTDPNDDQICDEEFSSRYSLFNDLKTLHQKMCHEPEQTDEPASLKHFFLERVEFAARQVLVLNPFFLIMPQWFILPGTIIATLAAIIASQALISGSFTLVSEAVKLNIFPKLQVHFPNEDKGKLYIPAVNLVLYFGCVILVLNFKKSSNMEAAYGLAISITMLMTTILLSQYIKFNLKKKFLSNVILIVFGVIEVSFLYANLFKFVHGGYVTILISGMLMFLMYIWLKGSNIKHRYTQWVKIEDYKEKFKALKEDTTVPLFCTNLVYISQAEMPGDIESKIIYSIFNKQPKRAKFYWFVNVKVTDEPYTKEYYVKTIVPNETYCINFRLGFRVDHKVNEFLNQIIQELVQSKEIIIEPKEYWITNENKVVIGDFKFVLLEEILPNHIKLSKWDNFIISVKLLIKRLTTSQAKWYGIDTSITNIEKVPVIVGTCSGEKLTRMQ